MWRGADLVYPLVARLGAAQQRVHARGDGGGRPPLSPRQLACMDNATIMRYLAGEAAWSPIIDPATD